MSIKKPELPKAIYKKWDNLETTILAEKLNQLIECVYHLRKESQ